MIGNIEAAFVGRVGTDPEKHSTSTGKPMLRFSMAVGQDEATQWVQVACFGDVADALTDRLAKGDRLYVEGNLRLNTWTAKDGKERSGLNITAWKAERLGAIGRNRPSHRDRSRTSRTGDDAIRSFRRPLDDAPIPFCER